MFHDAHIHYDKDVWDALPANEAIELLEEQGIERALVSATPTEGAEMMYREDPDIVVPMLRPYKNWKHRHLWFKDPDLKRYLLEHLARVPYRGFGEFHVFGEDVNTAPVDDMIQLAREKNLVLHPHTDLAGMRNFLKKTQGIPVMWAHGGFDVPVDTLRELLEAYPHLYIELSLRERLTDEEHVLQPEWERLLKDFPTRFLAGTDTFKPSRWAELPEISDWIRAWLGQVPADVAQAVAKGNFERLFPVDKR